MIRPRLADFEGTSDNVKDAVSFGTPFLFQRDASGTQRCLGLRFLEITLLAGDLLGEFNPSGVLRFAQTVRIC